MALSSITNNTLLQQQALQSQLAATQATAAAQTADTTSAAPTTAAAANPATALVSGNAALTSDLLSVLLNEQSGASSGTSGDGGTTLAQMFDQQDSLNQNGAGDPAQAQDDAQSNLLAVLDASSTAQSSATSTGSVLSGIQSLLAQLSV